MQGMVCKLLNLLRLHMSQQGTLCTHPGGHLVIGIPFDKAHTMLLFLNRQLLSEAESLVHIIDSQSLCVFHLQ